MLKEYKIQTGETIYSIAIKLYGEVSYAIKLANDNNIGLNDSTEGLTFTYDTEIKKTVLQPLIIQQIKPKNMLQNTNSKFGQSIFDLALNLTGSLENAVSLANSSNMTNINNALDSTYTFTYTESLDPLVLWAKKRDIIFNSGVQLEQPKLGEYDSSFDQQAFS